MEAHVASTPWYGLDIETDTSVDGLDPRTSSIVAFALAGEGFELVGDGDEAQLLTALDEALAELEPGVIVTWNGAAFDLPYINDRAARRRVPLGLRLAADPAIWRRDPLPGHDGGYRASWYRHRHLDGYQLFRADAGAALGVSCGLKPLARFVGLTPVEVPRDTIHELDPALVRRYVLSDAVLARELVLRRLPTACAAVDPLVP